MRNSMTFDNRAGGLRGSQHRWLYNLLFHFCVWLLLQPAGMKSLSGVWNQEENKTHSGFATDNLNILNLVHGKRNVYFGFAF